MDYVYKGVYMSRNRSKFKTGSVEMVILFLLSKEDLYGYQLTNLIKKLSNGKFVLPESTLYPTLYKLLEKEYISDYEQSSTGRRTRTYYHLEELGFQYLNELIEDYTEITKGIHSILSVEKLED